MHGIEYLYHVPQMGEILNAEIVAEEKVLYSRSVLRLLFAGAIDNVSNIVVGRRTEILMIFAAILSRQNVMLFGSPGEGKSFLAQTVFSLFDQTEVYPANIFSTQFFLEMPVETVLGGIPVDEMLKGNTNRITTGRLPEANFAFLDELGKAPDSVLSALLSMLNERTFYNGTNAHPVPLVSAIAATNEDDFDVAGLSSRFLVKINVERLGTIDRLEVLERKANAHKFYTPVQHENRINMRQLYWATVSAAKIDVDSTVLTHLVHFAEHCENNGIQIDTRQLSNAIAFLKAYCWLSGKSKIVGTEHLRVCPYILATRPSEFSGLVELWKQFAQTLLSTSKSTRASDATAPESENLLSGLLG
jgi:MoxR-like ATPase